MKTQTLKADNMNQVVGYKLNIKLISLSYANSKYNKNGIRKIVPFTIASLPPNNFY